MSKNNSLTVSGTLSEQHAIWKDYRELPTEVRDRVAEIMFGDEDFTMAGVNRKLGKIMIEVLRGNIPPGVDAQLQGWFDRLMLNIHTMHVAQGTEKAAGRDIGATIVNLIQTGMERPVRQYLMPPEEPLPLPGPLPEQLIDLKEGTG